MTSAAPSPTAPAPGALAAPPPVSSARAVRRAGRLLAGALVVAAALREATALAGLRSGLAWGALFAVCGLALAAGAALLLDRAFARGLAAEIARGNTAAALVGAGHRVAAGILVSRCVHGADLPTLGVSSVFVVLGVATLVLFTSLHRGLTRYHDAEEIRGENAAAALGSAGLTIALGIIVAHAADGTFLGWGPSLRAYGLALLLCLGLYPVRQVVVKRLLLGFPLALRGGLLDRAIGQARDEVTGAIEGLAYVAVALFVTGLS